MSKYLNIIIEKVSPIKNWVNAKLNKITESESYQDAKNFIFAKSFEESNVNFSQSEDLREAISKPIKFAFTVISIAVGFFIIWGGLAPLDQASMAEGVVQLSSSHKDIQHLEGGLIEEILVKDGDKVKAGQLLLKINDTQAKASLQIVQSQFAFALAEQARLSAQQDEKNEIDWDFEILGDFNPVQLAQIKKTQTSILEKGMNALNGQLNILAEQENQKKQEITGLEYQLTAAKAQQSSYAAELQSTQNLFKKGLAHKPRLMELQRANDELSGRVGNLTSAIASAKQDISQINIKMLAVRNEFHQKVSDDIKENHRQILDLSEKYNATRDVLNRTQVRAPVDGIVIELKHFTVGGVIPQGQNIMEIIPENDKLIIEAHILTQDIDSIYPGMLAKIQLGAFKARTVPRVEGKIVYVASDRHMDERTGMSYYLAKIEVDEKELAKIAVDIKLQPGMPATVFIVKGTRTMLQYLLSPLIDSFHRAFKEA